MCSSMIFLTEQDHISTEQNYIETVIKQYRWGKTSAAPGYAVRQMHRDAEHQAAVTASQLK